MKKLINYLFPVLLMVACGGGVPMLHAATVTVKATYTFSATNTVDASGNWPACSATITSTCVSGFKVYDSTTSTYSVIGILNTPTTPSGTQTFQQNFTDNTLTYGSHSAVATTMYVDSSGATKETAYSAPTNYVYSAGTPAIIILNAVSAK